MKRYPFVLLLLFVIVGVTRSQTFDCRYHPTDSSAVKIGSLPIDVAITGPPGSPQSSTDVITSLIIFRLSSGKNDYLLCPDSIHFEGDSSRVDTLSASYLFDLLGRAAAAQCVIAGYSPCNSNCAGPDLVRIWQPTCVSRHGHGTATTFTTCGTAAGHRDYGVCCPSGPLAPNVSLMVAVGTGCALSASGCESVIP
jgi:hypothetical protein